MKAGPKARVDPSPVPLRTGGAVGTARFAAFCEQFLVIPKGSGARQPFRLRQWQLDLVASILDADPRPRTAGWMMPRGQGKSTLVAALGLFDMLLGEEGASVVVAATDERQAGIVFRAASRMVELNPELESRVQPFKQALKVPERGASFEALPAEPKRLEGLDPTLAILDEIGVIGRETYEVVSLAQGKRETSTLLGIGTPGPDPHDSVLSDLRAYAAGHPKDKSLVWREFSAAGFEDHPPDCAHCWTLANPALDDFLHRDAMTALLPPKTREATFRRARLCQFVSEADGRFLPPGTWESLDTGEHIADGTEVVLALDGSFSEDTTALLLATVSPSPHMDTLAVWDPAETDQRVPIADVEQAIRDACRRWQVAEIIADPFRWTRTLQALEAEGLPVVEFPHSPSRLTAATGDLFTACVNGRLSHSGETRLAEHVAAAIIKEDARGIRLDKASKKSNARKIDLASCLVMAHSRATWRATRKTRTKTRSFA